MENKITELQPDNGGFNQTKLERDFFIENLKQNITDRDEQIAILNKQLDAYNNQITSLRSAIAEKNRQFVDLLNSNSWRITAPLRRLSSLFRYTRHLFGCLWTKPGRLIDELKYAYRYGLATRIAQIEEPTNIKDIPTLPTLLDLRRHKCIPILTTHHCLYIAELIVYQLARAGIRAEIIFEEPLKGYSSAPHFVICPQMFSKLPEIYVAFQMEQTVNSRWLTDEYKNVLENSFAVFDYSLNNIAYFSSAGISQRKMHYVPISWLPNYCLDRPWRNGEKEYDVLFYGDCNNDRRRNFIKHIEEHYRIKVIGNLFGDELYRELCKAKVVVNIHYYEGALLETTRIYECLSLDCLVVSESSSDIEQHASLYELVDFVEIGDTEEMVSRIGYWLEDDERREKRVKENRAQLEKNANNFEYFFHRFLLATSNLSFEQFYRLAGNNIQFSEKFVCLGLPESVERRAAFEKDNNYGIQYFPGLRSTPGWIGCGLSYKFIMRKAAEQGLPWIIVCEDDVEFIPDWQERFDKVLAYLVSHLENWDIFSGFIADLHQDTCVTGIIETEGLELVHIDKMVSMVFNVYNASIFKEIQDWDENNLDVYCNTVDRYLESRSKNRVLTIQPFLVGHKEEHTSTVWGFNNTQYVALIEGSKHLLEEKIKIFRLRHQAQTGMTQTITEVSDGTTGR